MSTDRPSFVFDDPDFFATGAVGPPGQRVFHLQAGDEERTITLKCEKQQVAALGEHLARMLADLPPVPPDPGSRELREPLHDQWPVGNIGLAYQEDADRIIIVCEELVLPDEPAEEPPDAAEARFSITRAQAWAFVASVTELLEGGRARCLVCGEPMDPAGHVCPRSNGHRKPAAT